MPPVKIIPTFLFLKVFFVFKTAASGTAQDGSQIIFILSHINFIEKIISSSETVIIFSAPPSIISNVLFDKDVISPSAIVLGFLTGISFFSLKDIWASDAFFGSAKITFVFGEKKFVDSIVPEARPPPPTGHKM